MEYAGEEIVGRLRIVGIPVMKFPQPEDEAEDSETEDERSGKKEKKSEDDSARERETTDECGVEASEKQKNESVDDSELKAEPTVKHEYKSADDEVHVNSENTPESNGNSDSQSNEESNEDHKDDSSPKPPKKKHVSIIQKVRDIFAKISDILKNIREWVEKIKMLIFDEKNQAAFSHLKQELIYLLKKSVPRKMHVQATFSTGSPDTTGEVLGVIAMFPMAYQNRWNIAPDFEADHFYVEGEAELSGRIFIYQLAGIILRILKDRNCRRLFKKIKG
jgi:hypothetical protein